jgi:hypothetical protein
LTPRPIRRNQIVVTGQLEDSLRHEIESYIEGRLTSIKEEVSELQSQLNASLSRLLERQTEVQMDGSMAASILEHLRAAHEEGVDLAASESSRAKASSDMAIVKAAIEEIGAQPSQSEILKTLVNRAAAFAPRVAFFVIKRDQATGWRARGFEGTVGDRAIQQITLSTDADTIVGGVVRSKTTWSGGVGSHADDHSLLSRLGDEPPQRIVSVPLSVRGRVVAVLYADSAALDSEAINLEALETLCRVASMAVELTSVGRAKPAAGAAPEVAPQRTVPEPQPTYTPTREYDEPAHTPVVERSFDQVTPRTPVVPEPERAPSVSGPLPPVSGPLSPVSGPLPPVSGPLSDPYSASETHSATPETYSAEPISAQAPVESAVSPLGSRRRFGMDAELPVNVANDEERRIHNDARRFARLLVSEIKLYNEQKVAEGRSQSDLYDRLREYIDRSREMYDKRVKPEVALRYDYFHQELVSTLAEGDVAKLGVNYPGATVTA